jgi:putative endonuclease
LISSAIINALPLLPQQKGDWDVYLLLCNNGAFYCGISNRLEIRWQAHVAGKGARYTRMYPPEQMRVVCRGIGKSIAAQCEYQLKQLTAADKACLWRLLDNFKPAQG